MSHMIKKTRSKLKSSFSSTGRSDSGEKQLVECSVNESNVDQAYIDAFRSESYGALYDKVQNLTTLPFSSSSSSPLSLPSHLSGYLLEPPQKDIIDLMKTSNLHPLLIDFFLVSVQVCRMCESLLHSIHHARANYGRIISLITAGEPADINILMEALASFAMLSKPMLILSPLQFCNVLDSHDSLHQQLKMKLRKMKRRAMLTRYGKKIAGWGLLVSCNVIALTLLVVALHSVVGIVAVPALVACNLGLAKTLRGRRNKRSDKGKVFEVAKVWVYIWMRVLETMSGLARELDNHIEHNKAAADMCVRSGKREVMKEVIGQFQREEARFLEKLDELEKQIFLCLHHVNRSRRLVVEEIIMGLQQQHR